MPCQGFSTTIYEIFKEQPYFLRKQKMSIKWGNYSFDGPYQINDWNPPYRAAVYAIMGGTDKPNTFELI
jgi:hypothetical protein